MMGLSAAAGQPNTSGWIRQTLVSIALMIFCIMVEAADTTSTETAIGHKALSPLNGRDYITFALLLFFLIIASAGGIGYVRGSGYMDMTFMVWYTRLTRHKFAYLHVCVTQWRRNPCAHIHPW